MICTGYALTGGHSPGDGADGILRCDLHNIVSASPHWSVGADTPAGVSNTLKQIARENAILSTVKRITTHQAKCSAK